MDAKPKPYAVAPLAFAMLVLPVASVAQQPAGAPSALRVATSLDSLVGDVPAGGGRKGDAEARVAPGAAEATVLSQPQQWLPERERCVNPASSTPWQSLGLADAVESVLCQSPALRQAMASVAEQRATVVVGEAAWLPRVSANAEFASDRIPLTNSAASPIGTSLTGSIGLSWTLFDFGQRDAALSAARAGLSAALSSQDGALLQSLSDVLRLYVDAATAWARLEATRETERVAAQTREIASARHGAQIGSLIEKLQAQTAHAQASLERVRAAGTWDVARGALASAMGRPVSQPIALAPTRGLRGIASGELQFANLRAEALAQHPKLRALRAERLAQQSRLEALKAESRGVVALSSNLGVTRSFAGGGSTERGLGASVSASVPLFNRTEQQAREQQVLAQIAAKEAALQASEREVELELWRAAQLANGEAEGLNAARQLLDNAEAAYNIALGRYRSGVGAMLEMLSAQSALAQATASNAQAEVNAIASRIRLSLAAGRMQLSQQ